MLDWTELPPRLGSVGRRDVAEKCGVLNNLDPL